MRDNLSIVAVTYLETVLYILNNPLRFQKEALFCEVSKTSNWTNE